MKLSYRGVRAWLEENAKNCTFEELCTLQTIIEEALQTAEAQHKKLEKAKAEMQALAKEIGVGDVASLVRLVTGTAIQAPAAAEAGEPVRKLRANVRKPYMDPFDPESDIYSLQHLHPDPEWFIAAQEKGWTKEECHYKRLMAAWRARGMQPLYDPIARHAELVAMEKQQPVFQRVRKN